MGSFASERNRNIEKRPSGGRSTGDGDYRSATVDASGHTAASPLKTSADASNRSPRVQSQLQLARSLNEGPRAVAQRRVAEALLARSGSQTMPAGDREGLMGDATQLRRSRKDEETAQAKCTGAAVIKPTLEEDEEQPETSLEAEEMIQGKFASVQREEGAYDEDYPMQAKLNPVQGLNGSSTESVRRAPSTPESRNRTGLPDDLKTGIENLSDRSLDDVKVHYNSAEPAQLNALAYTQGKDIHVGPGQQKHLAHEAWHVVQQAEGRVRPTMQMRGTSINDDSALEREADEMGSRAVGESGRTVSQHSRLGAGSGDAQIQRKISFELNDKQVDNYGAIAQELKKRFADLFDGYDEKDISEALVRMDKSMVNFGIINLDEGQHVKLLAFQVQGVLEKKGISGEQEEKEKAEEWEKLKGTSEDASKTYKLAFLGAGSSVAYYLNSLGRSYDHRSTLVIGEQDPWEVTELERSRGQGYIGHTRQEIVPYGKQVPKYDEELVNRPTFAETNRGEINAVPKENQVNATVESVNKDPETGLYVIKAKGETYYARKVVAGLGAGPHTVAPEAKTFYADEGRNEESLGYVMDMDAFMRMVKVWDNQGKEIGKGKTVIVVGPNAGIDVAEAAGRLGFNVEWFISDAPPPLLPGASMQQPFARKFAKENTHIAERGTTKITKSGGDPPLKVTYNNKSGESKALSGDYYVYAIGQDVNAPGAAGRVLSGVKEELEPIYDKNMALGDRPYKTVLGLKTPGTDIESGLEVIGASTFSLGGNVSHTYVEESHQEALGILWELRQKMVILGSNSDWQKLYRGDLHALVDLAFELQRDSYSNDADLLEMRKQETNAIELAQKIHKALQELQLSEKDLAENVTNANEINFAVLGSYFGGLLQSAASKLQDLAEASVYFSKPGREELDGDINRNIIPSRVARTGVLPELMSQVRSQPTDILLPPQLGPMRSSIGALTAGVPEYITKESNYSSDDRNLLRIFMAVNYPSLKEEDAEHVMKLILSGRREGYHPYGYRSENDEGWPDWYEFFDEILQGWNQYRKEQS